MENGGTLRHNDLTATLGGLALFSYLYVGDSVHQMCHEARYTDVSIAFSW